MLSASTMLLSAMDNILLDFLPVDMKGSLSISYFPHVDMIGSPQCDVQSASSITVGVDQFSTACSVVSSFSSLSPSSS